jgi:hypothetical protein
MPGAESQVGLGMGEVMVPEAGAQHDSTDERTFQKIPSGKTTAHRKPPFFSLCFSATASLYIMARKKSMAEGPCPPSLFARWAEGGFYSRHCPAREQGRYAQKS